MKKTLILGIALVASLSVVACKKKPATDMKPAEAAPNAKAGGILISKSGSHVSGEVTFLNTVKDGLTMTVKLKGATPGVHGIHVHDKGDCAADDASTAGPHFNPMAEKHGGPATEHHHAGDLGNITVEADGHATYETIVKTLKFEDVIGKSIIVHEKADDLATDPSGNSGARQACAVITKQ